MGLFDFYSKPVINFVNERPDIPEVIDTEKSCVSLYPIKLHDSQKGFLFTFDTMMRFEIPEGYMGLIVEDETLCEKGFNIASNLMMIRGKSEETLKITLAQIDCEMPLVEHSTPIAKLMLVPVVPCDFNKN